MGVVTEPPHWTPRAHLYQFLLDLHRRLFAAVRGAGHRSLALPTLGTGGMGYPPEVVCKAAARAAAEDFAMHPSDAIRYRVCCFDRRHLPIMEACHSAALHWAFGGAPNVDLHKFQCVTPDVVDYIVDPYS